MTRAGLVLAVALLAGCSQEYDVPKLKAHYEANMRHSAELVRETCQQFRILRELYYEAKRAQFTLEARARGGGLVEWVDSIDTPNACYEVQP